jgi:RHS repeat-associated protein
MASHTYYPYGVEYTATANDMEKYATYTRDTLTGLDYAVNRYYSSIWGRFTSPDWSAGSLDFANPQTWNRYGYTVGDPVNDNDPDGLCSDVVAGITQNPVKSQDVLTYAGETGSESAFPYAGQSFPAGLRDVNSQSNGTFTPATTTAAQSIDYALQQSPSGTITLFLFSGGAQAANAAWWYQKTTPAASSIDYVVYVSPGFGFGQEGNILRGTKGTYWISNPNDVFDQYANEGTGTQLPLAGVTYLTTTCHHDFTCAAKQFQDLFSRLSGAPCKNTTTFVRQGYGAPGGGPVGGGPPAGRVIGDPFGWLCLLFGGPCSQVPSE